MMANVKLTEARLVGDAVNEGRCEVRLGDRVAARALPVAEVKVDERAAALHHLHLARD